jgi:hypothetical protein
MNIFLSHASEDRGVAESIAFSLRGRGHKVFLDRDDLPLGGSYDQRIESAVNGSETFVFLISPDSVAKGRYTQTELMFARRKWPDPNGRVLPVLVRETPREEIPPYLTAVSYLEPVGNIAAETSSTVHNMRPPKRRWDVSSGKYRKILGLGAILAMAAVLVFVLIALILYHPSAEGWEKISAATIDVPMAKAIQRSLCVMDDAEYNLETEFGLKIYLSVQANGFDDPNWRQKKVRLTQADIARLVSFNGCERGAKNYLESRIFPLSSSLEVSKKIMEKYNISEPPKRIPDLRPQIAAWRKELRLDNDPDNLFIDQITPDLWRRLVLPFGDDLSRISGKFSRTPVVTVNIAPLAIDGSGSCAKDPKTVDCWQCRAI